MQEISERNMLSQNLHGQLCAALRIHSPVSAYTSKILSPTARERLREGKGGIMGDERNSFRQGIYHFHTKHDKNSYVYRFNVHCTENRIYVFPEKELRGLSPNSYIHVSVS
jgi:hypothetical protein